MGAEAVTKARDCILSHGGCVMIEVVLQVLLGIDPILNHIMDFLWPFRRTIGIGTKLLKQFRTPEPLELKDLTDVVVQEFSVFLGAGLEDRHIHFINQHGLMVRRKSQGDQGANDLKTLCLRGAHCALDFTFQVFISDAKR